MTGKRTRYSADFKAKVALEALRGELTTAQLAAKHGIRETMVGDWKRQAMEGLTAVFSGKAAAPESAKVAEAEVLAWGGVPVRGAALRFPTRSCAWAKKPMGRSSRAMRMSTVESIAMAPLVQE